MKCKKEVNCETFRKANFCNHCAKRNIVSSNGNISRAGKDMIKCFIHLDSSDVGHLIYCH